MKILKTALLLLAVASIAMAQSVVFNAMPYDCPLFRANFPGENTEVKFASDTVDTKAGVLVHNTYALQKDKLEFSVQYANLPGDSVFNLEKAIDGAFGILPAYEESYRVDALLSGLHAREAGAVTTTGDKSIVFFIRVATRGPQVWMSIIICDRGTCSRADADKFFDSVVVK